ncbi:MAG TPA: pilus assembly protein TadG-related protein [Pirellulales bacterium]|nr:pilus assembly protein TadG-related protein [Pirellulales bacterium]
MNARARRAAGTSRRGTITVLMALLAVPFLGMVAFAVDVAWIVQSRSDLQNAADAAALAGAEQLMNGSVLYSLPSQTQKATILMSSETIAKTYAKNFAGYNTAGGVSSLTLNDSDIQFGFTDGQLNYTPAPTYTGFPNTVKVTMRLDSQANGTLKLFFAPIFGISSTSLNASAAATIYTGNIVNFKSTPGINGALLPLTLDINAWKTFVQTGVSSDGTTKISANGAPQMQVYPSPNLAPGNFGMLSLNDSSNAASDINTWIANGLSQSDIGNLQSAGLIPIQTPNAGLWDWKGATGFKSSDLNNLPVGSSFLLPVFEPVVGEPGATYEAASGATYQSSDNTAGGPTVGTGAGVGQNAYYNIYAFVGVKITQVDSSQDAMIQPAAVMDPTAVFDPTSVVPAGTTSTLVSTFTTPKLTQ